MLVILLILEELKNEFRSEKDLKIKLRDIVENYEIQEQEFEYAGTIGIAELLGWQIVFFRKEDDLVNTIAVSFNEIDTSELINIANSILKSIDINIRFGDSIDVIKRIYGIADFTDSLYGNIIRYNYIISEDLFLAFGLKDDILSSLEIIADENMIKEIINVRKDNG